MTKYCLLLLRFMLMSRILILSHTFCLSLLTATLLCTWVVGWVVYMYMINMVTGSTNW